MNIDIIPIIYYTYVTTIILYRFHIAEFSVSHAGFNLLYVCLHSPLDIAMLLVYSVHQLHLSWLQRWFTCKNHLSWLQHCSTFNSTFRGHNTLSSVAPPFVARTHCSTCSSTNNFPSLPAWSAQHTMPMWPVMPVNYGTIRQLTFARHVAILSLYVNEAGIMIAGIEAEL